MAGSWLALVVLLVAAVVFLFTGGRGWMWMTYVSRAVDVGQQSTGSEIRLMASQCAYRLWDSTLHKAAFGDKLSPHNTRGSTSKFGEADADMAWAPPVRPDRVSGQSVLGIGFEDRYREVPVRGQLGISIGRKSWHCWTLWPAILLLALSLPAIRVAVRALRRVAQVFLLVRKAFRNQRAHLRGVCPGCGYDVRATPQRCPECGRVQYADSVRPPWFPRRMTWKLGGLLLLLALPVIVLQALLDPEYADSYVREILSRLLLFTVAGYWVAIAAWAIRHVILDLRSVVRVYGE